MHPGEAQGAQRLACDPAEAETHAAFISALEILGAVALSLALIAIVARVHARRRKQ